MPTAADAEAALLEAAEPERVPVLQRYFRTGPGEYGEGDEFLGVRMPAVRRIARRLRGMPLGEIVVLLQSRHHEARMLALLLLVDAYRRGDDAARAAVYRAYLANTSRINGWDLVDVSAEHIVGAHLMQRDRAPLRKLARSDSLWERRIAMLATFHFIRRGDHADALDIAALLLNDDEPLIHKAVGWMLREVGKRDRPAAERFLRRHHAVMPRTALRYAIERFDPGIRRQYLTGDVRKR